ncbi:uncharacterized protein N7479_005629 [Penicillium vulpinum]|uniref:uncharacterized protein n=1 Tax=Penicillium vulpinum TaxID=29845 RepID=UPI002548F44A|nr:uncharacterized protein N7479_005629 [Penicillium vulpinum]KAJ5958479.1 hypothetical protein N7479_005629 [Penicillium vulpinum]
MREGLDLPEFGYLPFDHFVIANWDTASPLSQNEQKRILVEKWIALGKYGRNVYINLPNLSFSHLYPLTNKPKHFALATFADPIIDDIPVGVPQDLLSEDDRALNSMLSTTLWIRTWFGDPKDKSQEAADTAYARLRKTVLQQGRENYHISYIPKEFVFEDRQELSADAQRGGDVIRGVAAGCAGSVPGYLVAALMHCPELFEGMSDDDWRHFTGEERAEELAESDRVQSALVLVADRKACEEGWVLVLAVNHRGEILPFRVRERAKDTAQIAVNWLQGQPLSEVADDEDEDVEFYLGGGDGWE